MGRTIERESSYVAIYAFERVRNERLFSSSFSSLDRIHPLLSVRMKRISSLPWIVRLQNADFKPSTFVIVGNLVCA